jgi:predicted  nucleic acid-binding Zn-ribbon protein
MKTAYQVGKGYLSALVEEDDKDKDKDDEKENDNDKKEESEKKLNHQNSSKENIEHLLGFKLIVIVDKYRVNLSPLKDNKDIIFLYDQNLLPICLDKLSKIDKIENEKKNFFYYSPNYHLWNSLINE